MRVVHVITGLEVGGAELALVRLLPALRREGIESRVVSLCAEGPVAALLRAEGVGVTALGMRTRASATTAIPRLYRCLRRERPTVVQTWMYHADLAGGLAARLSRVPAVVWGVRATGLHAEKPRTRQLAHVAARLSRLVPDAIVCCAVAARDVHVGLGYDRARMVVIPNGFDVPKADASARAEVRREFGLPRDARLIGRIGRYHAQKDYGTLAGALGRVLDAADDVHVLLVGEGVDVRNDELRALLAPLPHRDRVHLLGPRDDVDRLHQALDVACSSSSSGEAFPNVVAEALLAGVPVVATNVGDSARIVGAAGRVVPARDAAALARAIVELLSLDAADRRAIGDKGRARVSREYAIDLMGARYAQLYRALERRSAREVRH